MARFLPMLQGGPVEVVQKPNLGQALYAEPNPDGTTKRCENCLLWITEHQAECVIHAPEVFVGPDFICGYHVFGPPYPAREDDGEGIAFVDPELSGLEQVPGGTACEVCSHYDPMNITQGYCHAVDSAEEPGSPAVVAPKGCCNMWEGRGV